MTAACVAEGDVCARRSSAAIPNEEFFGLPARRIRRPWRVIRAGVLDAGIFFFGVTFLLRQITKYVTFMS